MQQTNRRQSIVTALSTGLGAAALLAATPALGATYQVGPGKSYASLDAVARVLAPGDVVEVDGDTTYPGDITFRNPGSNADKITIRGVRVNGRRPVLSGGANTVVFGGDHYVFEGFDVTGGASRCIFNRAADVTIRDSVVHDCAGHGILGADSDSGSLTLEYVEVYGCGSGDTRHQIYIATDEETHLGSVFRMQHCYVHDGVGGNNVKTRAERNEIYYNWIEGAKYHEIELIGPDGQEESLAREDSDVVGNVFRKTGAHFVARVGGDGTGQTFGRYRFVNNTFLLAPGGSAAIRMFDGIESVEISNNVFYRVGGGGVELYVDRSASWGNGGAVIAGANNWVPDGSTATPTQWTGTLTGKDPGFADVESMDLRPSKDSPLVEGGLAHPASPPGYPFPSPLDAPEYAPPHGEVERPGAAAVRPEAGTIDIGAYERPQSQAGVDRSSDGGATQVGPDEGDDVGASTGEGIGDDASPPTPAAQGDSAGGCDLGGAGRNLGGALGGGPGAVLAAAPLIGVVLRRRARRRRA